VHFVHPLKERIVREVGYGLSLEGASAADLVKSMQAQSELVAEKRKIRVMRPSFRDEKHICNMEHQNLKETKLCRVYPP
jgi:hypothetical protein